MKYIIWFLSLFFLLVIQAGVLVPLHVPAVNLILVMVVAATLLSEFEFALGLTLTGGLLLDFVSGTPDGILTASTLIVFLLLYFIVNSIIAREPNQIILFSSVAATTIGYFLIVELFYHTGYKFVLTRQLPWALLFNLLLTYPVFMYYLLIQKWTIRSK
jgi:hypothetical protein